MRFRFCGLMVLIVACSAGLSAAAPMAYMFSGVIDRVLEGTNPLGTEFSGLFTFDSDAQDLDPTDPFWGDYRGPSFSMALDIGPYTGFSDQGNGMILVANDIEGKDGLGIAAESFPIGGGLWITSINVGLTDLTGSVFSSDSLPIDPFPWSGFQASFFVKGYNAPGIDSFALGGTLTSFTVIPEPTAMLLMAMAFGLLLRR